MKTRTLSISLAVTLASVYFLASFYINGIQNLQIHPATWELSDVIQAIENYDFNGVWYDKSQKILQTIPNFHHMNGTAHIQFGIDKFELAPFRFLNVTNSNQTGYWIDVRLNDGFAALQNKFVFRLRVPSINQTTSEVHVQRKTITRTEVKTEECILFLNLKISTDRAQKSNLVEDLAFNFYITSVNPSCEMDMHLSFRYNNSLSNQSVYRFLVFSFLIALYEFVLLMHISNNIENNDNICKNQGVIFWTTIGMFNCLFCFININGSTENTEKLSLFFANAMLNFVNFAIVILKILHRIGKVHLNEVINSQVV